MAAGGGIGVTASYFAIRTGTGSGLALGVVFLIPSVASTLAAPPIVLGGSMGAAHALRHRQVTVSQVPVTVGWILLGTSLPLFFAAPFLPGDAPPIALGTSIGLYGGSLGLGAVQMAVNQRAWRSSPHIDPSDLPTGRASSGMPSMAWTVAPSLGSDGGRIVVAGTF